jgi:hypothetical protein
VIRLKQLKIEGCRGIKNGPDLNFSEGGLILQGDNGVGKSSYIDALEKVLTGSCSTVESGDQGISWARYGTNLESKKCRVELSVADGVKPYKFQFDGKQCKFPALEDFVSAARQQSFILRRRILLSFINCKPAERYKALEGFLNLSAFESFERGIRTAKMAEEAKARSKLGRAQESEQRIRVDLTIPAHEGVSLHRCIAAINATLSRASLKPIDSGAAAAGRLVEVNARLASFANIEELTKLTALRMLLQAPPSTREIATSLAQLISLKGRLAEEERKLRGSFFEEVLKMGIEWITTDKLETCPLCENSISVEKVRRSVERRLLENQPLTSIRDDVNRISTSLATSVPIVLTGIRNLNTAIPAPLDKGGYASLASAEEALAELSKVDAKTSEEDLRRLAQMLNDDGLQAEVSSLSAAVTAALEARPNEMDSFDKLTAASNALSCLKLEFSALEKLRGECQVADGRATDMKRVAEHAEASRKMVVAEVVAKVAELANQYFRKIHPDESIGSPSLEIAEVGTASLNLSSEFYSKVGDPRGLYSEGHIDSLGLCLFLAIRKMHQSQCPDLSILVLDDVLHSVDGDHRKRTAELIFDEFSDHQLIITTHDPIWYRYLCQKAQRSGRPFAMKRIAGWSLAEGPKWGDHLADYEWLASSEGLRALPKDRASKAGRLLEEILQNCCDRTKTAVPFQIKGDYTIDPLWNAYYKKAKSHKGFWEKAEKSLTEIEATRDARNFGAHWNLWSQQLTDKEAERFVNAVLSFRALVFCEDCSDFFNEIGQLEELWACKKMHLNYAKKGNIPVPMTT